MKNLQNPNATLPMTDKKTENSSSFYAIYAQVFATINTTHDDAKAEKVLINEVNLYDFDNQVDIARYLGVDKSIVNHAIKSGNFIYTPKHGAVKIYIIEE